jgi:hypothetical protein
MLPYTAKGILQMGLRILRWGDYPGFSEWTQCNYKGPLKSEREQKRSEKEM